MLTASTPLYLSMYPGTGVIIELPRPGATLFCSTGGDALTLIAGRLLQGSQDLTTQIGIATLVTNSISTAAPRRVAADPGGWPSATRRAVSRRASEPVFIQGRGPSYARR